MGFFATALVAVFLAYAAAIASTVESFNCSGSSGTTCNGLVGYVPANATTLSNITTLFAIQNSLNSLLGANNFPLTTSPNQSVSANQTVRIPFPCICRNGTGYPVNPPVHTVVSGDTMSDIATVVFSGLVTYQQIQAFNNVTDASLIVIGQELKIPLPCSCDEVGGERVVHYGYAVESDSSKINRVLLKRCKDQASLALALLSIPAAERDAPTLLDYTPTYQGFIRQKATPIVVTEQPVIEEEAPQDSFGEIPDILLPGIDRPLRGELRLPRRRRRRR
ncbi:hypothetical protein RHGRI_025504 [Rhododendron griersonianum]|uniref:LysM domain-containing protein n=1 Tax=Rhododendron griersonianum TaxID=479676 RepID=A0AAV6IQP5_9ERIC|nr:hypothetical protein RHGRI_025504 [Rhododendron griersonianum]